MDRADLAAREFESATAWWWNGDAEKSESQTRKDLKQQDGVEARYATCDRMGMLQEGC